MHFLRTRNNRPERSRRIEEIYELPAGRLSVRIFFVHPGRGYPRLICDRGMQRAPDAAENDKNLAKFGARPPGWRMGDAYRYFAIKLTWRCSVNMLLGNSRERVTDNLHKFLLKLRDRNGSFVSRGGERCNGPSRGQMVEVKNLGIYAKFCILRERLLI